MSVTLELLKLAVEMVPVMKNSGKSEVGDTSEAVEVLFKKVTALYDAREKSK